MPRDELPPLDKFVIASFEGNDKAYPQIVVARDNRAPGYIVPAMLAACPDPRYPGHVFVGVTPTNVDARVLWNYALLPGPVFTTTRVDEDGIPVTVTSQRMLPSSIVTSETLSASPTGTWTKKWRGDNGGDSVVAIQMTESRAIPGNVMTAKFYDPETDTTVTETRQLVAFDATEPTITNLFTDFRSLHNSEKTRFFVQRTYPSGVTSNTITEYEGDDFTYPALMSSVSTTALEKADGETLFICNPVIEAERPRYIAKKLTRTFQTTAPTEANILASLYPILPMRHAYNGVLFNLQTGPVICNANAGLTATTGNDDPVWGAGLVETYAWGATTPNYTDYVAARTAGDWKMVTPRISKKIAKSLYMIIEVKIPIL